VRWVGVGLGRGVGDGSMFGHGGRMIVMKGNVV
jgi:hypothetical protein